MESDEEEKMNQKKIEVQNIFSEDEILNSIDMKAYKDRIENLIGKQYSYLYFDCFENIYHSKIRNKMSASLNAHLNLPNNTEDSAWMKIFKSIIFFSKENVPILITKYFNLKAEVEFKFIYNESKKYTNYPNKFINVYIKKMKKINYKKLKEMNPNNSNKDIFGLQSKRFHLKSFFTKKTILRSRIKPSSNHLNTNEEEHSDSSKKEDDIQNKKKLRTQIMKQIHEMKLKSIKEVEKANTTQNKQKKKYGGIKSRFLDVFNHQQKLLRIENSKSTHKINNNLYDSYNFNKFWEENEFFYSSHRQKTSLNKSKLNYLNSRENIFSRKNSNKNYKSNIFSDIIIDKSYRRTQSNSKLKTNNSRNNIFVSHFNLKDSKNDNINKGLNVNYKFKNIFDDEGNNRYNNFISSSKNSIGVKKLILSDNIERFKLLFKPKNIKLRPKNGINNKKLNTNLLIKQLEKKRNKEFLDKIINQNCEKDSYNNKIFELFKRTEYY
jgi:hypothetical protein